MCSKRCRTFEIPYKINICRLFFVGEFCFGIKHGDCSRWKAGGERPERLWHKNKVGKIFKHISITVMVILILQCFIFKSIFEDIDDQISKNKKMFFLSPTTVTAHFFTRWTRLAAKTEKSWALVTYKKIDEWWWMVVFPDFKSLQTNTNLIFIHEFVYIHRKKR